jgi:hypothetical protein
MEFISVRVCGSYQDRGLLLTRSLLNQGLLLAKLKSSLWKHYGCQLNLANRYRISVSQMSTDMFRLLSSEAGLFDVFVTRITLRVLLMEQKLLTHPKQGRRGPDRMVVWIYNYLCNQCSSSLLLWVRISIRARCTTLCDNVFQWLATGRWFSPGPPLSSTNKTEILLKVALNTIKQNKTTSEAP